MLSMVVGTLKFMGKKFHTYFGEPDNTYRSNMQSPVSEMIWYGYDLLFEVPMKQNRVNYFASAFYCFVISCGIQNMLEQVMRHHASESKTCLNKSIELCRCR